MQITSKYSSKKVIFFNEQVLVEEVDTKDSEDERLEYEYQLLANKKEMLVVRLVL